MADFTVSQQKARWVETFGGGRREAIVVDDSAIRPKKIRLAEGKYGADDEWNRSLECDKWEIDNVEGRIWNATSYLSIRRGGPPEVGLQISRSTFYDDASITLERIINSSEKDMAGITDRNPSIRMVFRSKNANEEGAISFDFNIWELMGRNSDIRG